jgi:VanZ family protein
MINKIAQLIIKHLTLLRILTLIWLFLITILCLLPQDELPRAGNIPYFDKLVHFTFYFVLTTLCLLIFPGLKLSGKLLLAAGIFSFSFFIEIMQWILPFGRTFSLVDLLANLSGVIAGLLLFQKRIKYLTSQQ